MGHRYQIHRTLLVRPEDYGTRQGDIQGYADTEEEAITKGRTRDQAWLPLPCGRHREG